jgi:hypothetical protein
MKVLGVAVTIALMLPLPVEVVTVAGHRIRLAETSFAAVEKSLGLAKHQATGDGEAGPTQSCYQALGADPITVHFTSGEMGGGDRITEVSVVASKARPADYFPTVAKDCGVLRAASREILTDRGVTLGMTRTAVERRVGAGRDSAGVTTYEADGVQLRSGVRYDITSRLRVRYVDNRAVAFYALAFRTF